MRPDELLIGGLAIAFSVVAMAIAVGPGQRPYDLRNVAKIRDRFGIPMARWTWFVIGLATLATGGVILSGIRPGYAIPDKPFLDPAEVSNSAAANASATND